MTVSKSRSALYLPAAFGRLRQSRKMPNLVTIREICRDWKLNRDVCAKFDENKFWLLKAENKYLNL